MSFQLYSSIICNDDNISMSYTTLCLSNNNTIYSFGYSNYFSHGHEEKFVKIPKKIDNLENIQMISCGRAHTLCLDYNGTVFSFGNNSRGQLGNGNNSSTYIPQKINLPSIKLIECGGEFSMCLSHDGYLYSFGNNNCGELGLGNNDSYNTPQQICIINNIEFIICGGFYSICKTNDNEYYSWGNNNKYQLGYKTYETFINEPTQCLNWPNNIVSIKCGWDFNFLLTSEGFVYSFGNNEKSYQLDLNITDKNRICIPTLIKDIPVIKRIECGYYHTMFIDINNNLWVLGSNVNGKLGLGDKEIRHKPVLNPLLNNISDISSGGNHTFVKTLDNKIYSCGKNNYFQLGIETESDKQDIPLHVLKGNEYIWRSNIGKSNAKSARK